MNLIEVIQQEMATDTEDWEVQSSIMHAIYKKSSSQTKETLDEFLIALCGWDYSSLLERKDEN